MKKLLVLGVGNTLLMDEGIGVHAIYEFWKEKDDWDDTPVDFVDGGTFTQDIFYLFEEYEAARETVFEMTICRRSDLEHFK